MPIEPLNGPFSPFGPDSPRELERKINGNFAQLAAATGVAYTPVSIWLGTAGNPLDTPRTLAAKINAMLYAVAAAQGLPASSVSPVVTSRAYALHGGLRQAQLEKLFLQQWSAANPATRAQNIASAMRGPGLETGGVSNGTDREFNSETWHYNEGGVAGAVAIMTSTWWTDTDANGAERVMTGQFDVLRAQIEYPVGTRTAFTWSGSTTTTQAAGTNLVSDYVASIPAGALFGLHVFGQVASGVRWPVAPNVVANTFQPGGKVDRYESGALGALGDKTAVGTPGAAPSAGFRPTAALMNSSGFKKVCLASAGDSTSIGAGDGGFDGRNNRSIIGRAAGAKQLPVMQFGVTGTSAAASALNGKFALRLDAMVKAGVTDLFLVYGTNDMASSPTLVSLQNNLVNLAGQAAAAGIKVYTNTIMPRHATVPVDKGETIGRQVPPVSGPFAAGGGTLRAQYNAWVRTTPAPLSGFLEWADALDVNSSGVPARDGGYWITGETGSPYLDVAYSGLVTGTPTTTSVPTNITKAQTANYFAYYSSGFAVFSDNVPRLVGTNASGTLTFASGGASVALPAAPAAGDAVTLLNNRMAPAGDMVHPGVTDNTVTAERGGVFIVRDVVAAKLTAMAT